MMTERQSVLGLMNMQYERPVDYDIIPHTFAEQHP